MNKHALYYLMYLNRVKNELGIDHGQASAVTEESIKRGIVLDDRDGWINVYKEMDRIISGRVDMDLDRIRKGDFLP